MISALKSLDTGQPAFCFARELLEGRLVRTRDLGTERQVDRGDGKSVRHLLQHDLRGRLHQFRGEFGLAQDQRESHRETTGMRGREQLLGVAPLLAFKAAGESIRVVVQCTALGRERALAVLEPAPPYRRTFSLDLHR